MDFGFDVERSSRVDSVMAFVPSINSDERGDIWTSFEKEFMEPYLPDGLFFKHDKFSQSQENVLRGIHGDVKSWKLVTCVMGKILQVVTDLRKDSPTFGQWQAYEIEKSQQKMVLIPPGFGNSYYVMEGPAVYHYKLAYPGEYLDAQDQFSVRWDDPEIGIEWSVDSPILSPRDVEAPWLKDSGLV